MKGEVARYRGYHGGKCGHCGSPNTRYEIFHDGVVASCMMCERLVSLTDAQRRQYMEDYRAAIRPRS